MNHSTIRQHLDELRRSGAPELVAVADALTHYLEAEDPAAVKQLQPLGRGFALRDLILCVRDAGDPEAYAVVDFAAIAMGEGEAAFPVVRDTFYFPGKMNQTPAEDFAAIFVSVYCSALGCDDSVCQSAHRNLVDAADRIGVDRARLAALLLAELPTVLSFGWTDVKGGLEYLGWGLNIANSRQMAPSSDEAFSVLERVVWDLSDEEILRLLKLQRSAPKYRLGPFCHRFGKLHGALAVLRPEVLQRFFSEVDDEQLAGLNWYRIIEATPNFDGLAIGFWTRQPRADALRSLVLIESLRPGTCTELALEVVFDESTIPDESGLCFVRDHHPARLASYLEQAMAKADALNQLTEHARRTSYSVLAEHWNDEGRQAVRVLFNHPLVPSSSYSEGKASLQGTAFRGLLEAKQPPNAKDMEEILSHVSRLVDASPLPSRDKLEVRRYFYLAIVELHPELFRNQLWALFADRSKTMRDLAIEGLIRIGGKDVMERAIQHLAARKADLRGSAADLLARLGDPAAGQSLGDALEVEASDKVRESLHSACEACGVEVGQTGSVGIDILVGMIEENSTKTKLPKTGLVGLSALPALHFDDGAEVPETVVRFLIARQSKHKPIEAAPDIVPLLAHIDRDSSADFALALVEGFLDSEQAASDRWALTLGGLLGDSRVIPPLLSRIQGWCENSRHKLAEYAAQAISLLPGDEPLMVLDTLATRYRSKFKNVGKACAAAFEAAASAHGITPDELGDMVVPRFDFDEDGVRRFEWDGGAIGAELMPEFKLSWFEPGTDKSWKTLPKSVPQEAKTEIKTLNKLIRETVKGQTARLELSLVRQRRWPVARWRELYEDHPILRSFASRLVWGIYDASGSLLRTFRRYPNGLLADAAGGLEELEESDTTIGMVHPLELDEAALEAWRAHLGRMKVKPPFPQLERPIERLDPLHGNRRQLQLTSDKKVGAGTFKSRSEKRGWVRGSVVDAGGISSIYKPYPGAGIEAILVTEYYYVGIDPMDTVELGSAYFVKAESVERGSYTYDEPGPDDARVLRFDQVPAIVYSETVSDLKAILGEA